MMETSRQVRLNVFCSQEMRTAIKAIAVVEGKTVTLLFQEIMARKIIEYPEIAQRVKERELPQEP